MMKKTRKNCLQIVEFPSNLKKLQAMRRLTLFLAKIAALLLLLSLQKVPLGKAFNLAKRTLTSKASQVQAKSCFLHRFLLKQMTKQAPLLTLVRRMMMCIRLRIMTIFISIL